MCWNLGTKSEIKVLASKQLDTLRVGGKSGIL